MTCRHRLVSRWPGRALTWPSDLRGPRRPRSKAIGRLQPIKRPTEVTWIVSVSARLTSPLLRSSEINLVPVSPASEINLVPVSPVLCLRPDQGDQVHGRRLVASGFRTCPMTERWRRQPREISSRPIGRDLDRCRRMLPRQVLPRRFYLITRRCCQRQFLLRPDPATNNAFLYCLIGHPCIAEPGDQLRALHLVGARRSEFRA
jgi:hypothetical protein